MPIRTARVGLIVPSSNTVMEPDFHRQLGSSAVVSTTRIFLEDVTREAETQMIEEELPRALKLIRTTAPDVVIFGCTSAGALGKLSHDQGIGARIAEETSARGITVLGSVIAQLRSRQPRRLAVFTPYNEDLTRGVAASLAEAGYPPIKALGMGIQSNLDIGRLTPEEIIRFVESQMNGIMADCVFLSCTNLRGVEAIEPLSKKLGIPIMSSNQATIDAVRHAIGETRAASAATPDRTVLTG